MLEPQDQSVLWLLILGFIFAFILAFGIGANDVANSFGTSVGAKVLTLFQACIIAAIFELAGAVLIGAKVSDTVSKGIIDINCFNGSEEYAMVGAFSALTGTSVWLLVATFFKLPVSATHSIVGGTIGYALVAIGAKNIKWVTFGKIASSWIVSPLLSGIISSGIFMGINKLILTKSDPLKNGLRALPFLFGGTIFIILFSILYNSKEVFGMNDFAWYTILGICLGCAIVLAFLEAVVANPLLKKRILNASEDVTIKYESHPSDESKVTIAEQRNEHGVSKNEHLLTDQEGLYILQGDINKSYVSENVEDEKQTENDENDVESGDIIAINEKKRSQSIRSRAESVRSKANSVLQEIASPIDKDARSKIADDPYSAQLFKYLQILTAAFGSFAHGGNDVSNAIGPVILLWMIYQHGVVVSGASPPIWILVYGGVGIVVGLSVWGRRVIKTIGENLSPITPSSGFSIEIGSALTVLLASNLGIPVSTTHCKVGSVVIVGRVRSKEVVDWSLFRNIVISWIVTMPITGGISAAIYAIIRAAM